MLGVKFPSRRCALVTGGAPSVSVPVRVVVSVRVTCPTGSFKGVWCEPQILTRKKEGQWVSEKFSENHHTTRGTWPAKGAPDTHFHLDSYLSTQGPLLVRE